MGLDLSTLGTKTEPISFSYDWKRVVAYALGIGAKKAELPYLYEGMGPLVYPTFVVIPAYEAVIQCLARTGGNVEMIVHGAQSVTCHAPFAPQGTLQTVAELKAIYDMRQLAQVVVAAQSRSESGELIAESEWTILFRGEGGFGGQPPPRDGITAPRGQEPSFVVEETTTPEQALLYRLSGDFNPLHADPALAERIGFPQGPILHGLATFGFMARAVIQGALGGNAQRLKHLYGQFRKPVWPGETLVTEGYPRDDGRISLRVRVKERNETVIPNGLVTVLDP
jgi:acyl dehydratase